MLIATGPPEVPICTSRQGFVADRLRTAEIGVPETIPKFDASEPVITMSAARPSDGSGIGVVPNTMPT